MGALCVGDCVYIRVCVYVYMYVYMFIYGGLYTLYPLYSPPVHPTVYMSVCRCAHFSLLLSVHFDGDWAVPGGAFSYRHGTDHGECGCGLLW